MNWYFLFLRRAPRAPMNQPDAAPCVCARYSAPGEAHAIISWKRRNVGSTSARVVT